MCAKNNVPEFPLNKMRAYKKVKLQQTKDAEKANELAAKLKKDAAKANQQKKRASSGSAAS